MPARRPVGSGVAQGALRNVNAGIHAIVLTCYRNRHAGGCPGAGLQIASACRAWSGATGAGNNGWHRRKERYELPAAFQRIPCRRHAACRAGTAGSRHRGTDRGRYGSSRGRTPGAQALQEDPRSVATVSRLVSASYSEENAWFRDLVRQLSAARDAEAMLESLAGVSTGRVLPPLKKGFPEPTGAPARRWTPATRTRQPSAFTNGASASSITGITCACCVRSGLAR